MKLKVEVISKTSSISNILELMKYSTSDKIVQLEILKLFLLAFRNDSKCHTKKIYLVQKTYIFLKLN